MTYSPGTLILLGGMFIWGIYRRARRNIGQQKLRPRRISFSLVIFTLISVLLVSISWHQPKLLAGIGGGLILGAMLGLVGLRLTQFETTNEGHFYTPDSRLGIALSLLFAGRLLYRFWPRDHAPSPQLFQSPLTIFIFGIIAGYYIVYYTGLFVHTRNKKPPL